MRWWQSWSFARVLLSKNLLIGRFCVNGFTIILSVNNLELKFFIQKYWKKVTATWLHSVLLPKYWILSAITIYSQFIDKTIGIISSVHFLKIFPRVEDITSYEPPVQYHGPIVEDLESSDSDVEEIPNPEIESDSEDENLTEAIRLWDEFEARSNQMAKNIVNAGGEKNLTAEQALDICAGFRQNSINKEIISNLGYDYYKIKKAKENRLVKKQKLKRKCYISQPYKTYKEFELPFFVQINITNLLCFIKNINITSFKKN